MARGCTLLLAMSALALAVAGVLRAERSTERALVYSIAALRANLARDPYSWVGRTILVRGEVVPCLAIPSADNGRCAALVPRGWQPSSPTPWRAAIDPLPLVHAGLDSFLTPLRRLRLLGDLLPAPQVLQWGAVATYRVQVRAIPKSSCGTDLCFEAVLLDAAP